MTTTQAEANRYNNHVLSFLNAGESGRTKVASMLNTDIVSKILREDGIARRAFAVKPINPAELQTDWQDPDTPTVFIPVENLLNGYLVYQGDHLAATEDIWVKSHFYRIKFHTINSRKVKMTTAQLMAAAYPIRQVIESQVKNDFLAKEDYDLINRFERCIALTNSYTVASNTGGLLKKEHVLTVLKLLINKRLNAEQIFVNEYTIVDVLGWLQTEVGSAVMADIVARGPMAAEGLKYKSLFGIKWIVTNNADIVPQKVLYATANQSMLGAFYELQGPMTHVKFEENVFSSYSSQILGRAIVNQDAVTKVIIT